MNPVDGADSPAVSLREVLAVLRRWRVLLAVVTCLAGAGALVAAYVVPKQYEATVVAAVANPESRGMSAGGAVAGSLGGLASLVGISGNNTEIAEYLAVLESHVLAEQFVREHGLAGVLRPEVAAGAQGDWRATQFFREEVAAVRFRSSDGIVSLTMRWTQPQAAADWANGLMTAANNHLRQRALARSERRIQYLTEEAAKAREVEVRQAIYSVMEAEINSAMLARGSEEYAFRILDPAVAPERPATPPPWLWLAAALAASLAAFVLAAVVRVVW